MKRLVFYRAEWIIVEGGCFLGRRGWDPGLQGTEAGIELDQKEEERTVRGN